MSLSSSSLGPWQPTKNLSDSWGQHSPQPITHFPIKTKRTSSVTREPKFPSPHWFFMQPALLFLTGMEVPHPALSEQLISHQVLGGAASSHQVPLWQWGSSPQLSPGRHCWRCGDLLSPEWISPTSPSAWMCFPAQCRASCVPSRSGSSRLPLLLSLHDSNSALQR